MFGMNTLVVGNIPHTHLATAILEGAKQEFDDGLNNTHLVHVYEWAWLGDWVETVHQSATTGQYDRAKYPHGIIYGGPSIDGVLPEFHLNIDGIVENTAPGEITRRTCAIFAAEELICINQLYFQLVAAVILTEGTLAKQNCRIMLEELDRAQRSSLHPDRPFSFRLIVINDNGSVNVRIYNEWGNAY